MVEGGETGVELGDGTRSDDDGSEARVVEEPSERHLGERLTATKGEVVEATSGGEDVLRDLVGLEEALGTGCPRAWRNGAREIFVGEKTLIERRESYETTTLLCCER